MALIALSSEQGLLRISRELDVGHKSGHKMVEIKQRQSRPAALLVFLFGSVSLIAEHGVKREV